MGGGAFFFPKEEPGIRYGIVTSRRLGPAVLRNRIRRRLREALQSALSDENVTEGLWIVLVARRAAGEVHFGEMRKEIHLLVQNALGKRP